MGIFLVGISHRTAPVELREQLAIGEDRLRDARLTVPQGMHPLADFLPDDPRYRIAKEVREAGFRDASVELPSVTYAVVPSGFEQTIPEQGAPAALAPGHGYRVVLVGTDFGSLVFQAVS